MSLFYNGITGKNLLNGSPTGFRNEALRIFLTNALYLEPLNLFFYTWCFFTTLEKEEPKNCLKLIYRWFSRVSIVVVPVSYVVLFFFFVIDYAKYEHNLQKLNFKEATYYEKRSNEV